LTLLHHNAIEQKLMTIEARIGASLVQWRESRGCRIGEFTDAITKLVAVTDEDAKPTRVVS